MIKVRDLELLSKEQLLELSEAIDDNLESFDASEQKRREFEESLRALKTRAKKSFRVKSLQGQLADLEANRCNVRRLWPWKKSMGYYAGCVLPVA